MSTWKGRKMATMEKPHAVYTNELGWEWRVLKQHQRTTNGAYDRFYCAVKSPYTHGTYDYGDVYCADVMNNGRLS
jgi:hypothetical protein